MTTMTAAPADAHGNISFAAAAPGASRSFAEAVPTAPTPRPHAATPAAAPAEAARFNIWPRLTEHGEFIIAIEAGNQAAKATVEEIRDTGYSQCLDRLTRVRDEFFTSGSGLDYRTGQERVKAAQEATDKARATLVDLRTRWRSAVATDSASEVGQIEKQIGTQEAQVARLENRLPIMQSELERVKAIAVVGLAEAVAREQAAFTEETRTAERQALEELKEAAIEPWQRWLKARSEFDSVASVAGRALTQLRSLD